MLFPPREGITSSRNIAMRCHVQGGQNARSTDLMNKKSQPQDICTLLCPNAHTSDTANTVVTVHEECCRYAVTLQYGLQTVRCGA
jgi:hypothetical protein